MSIWRDRLGRLTEWIVGLIVLAAVAVAIYFLAISDRPEDCMEGEPGKRTIDYECVRERDQGR